MTDDNRRTKAQAVFFSLVMVLSMVGGTVAFAGGAAATVQDFDRLDAVDVTAGTSSVNQDVTLEGLENDGTAATITISNNAGLDNSVITDASVKTNSPGFDVSGVNVQSNGDIVVNLGTSGGGVTGDLVLDVTHDLSSTQDTTVTYNATTDSGISQTATFDVSVAQPDYDSAVIPEKNPDTLEVTFDEEVQADGTDSQVQNAFTISGASVSGASVNGFSEIKNGDTVVLDLDANVASDDSGITVDYDGSGNSNPLSNNADAAVDALDFSGESVTSDADPVITSAIVEDTDRDQIVITTSENVDASGLAADAFSLGDDQADVDEVDTASDDSNTIELSLNSSIEPGANLAGLSYDRAVGDVVASAGTDDELYAQDVTVSNNVVPSIQSAEVTSANPDRILVTYDGPVQSGDDGDVLGDFSVDILTIGTANDDANFTAGTDSQVALPLEGTAQASQGDFSNLDYSSGADGVESVAGISAENADNGNTVTNNVEPIITDATVRDGSPGEVQVTFRENVVANVSGTPDGNIDSAVTEAFEFKNSDVDLRIKNVESFGGPSSTITLNFGLADGTNQEVSATDDLAGALSYNPADPTDDAEKYPLIADGGTEAPVPQTQNFDVTNNVDTDVSVAKVTTNGDEIRVTFTEDINRVGTVSEVEDAFDVGQTAVTIDDSNTFDQIENGDTVVFDRSQEGVDFVNTESAYHSGTDFTGSNGIDYTAADGNNPLEVAGTSTAVGDFDSREDITNNIQPRIESAEVTNGDRDEIQVTYTEDISGSDGNAYESFSLDGSDAPSITGQNDVSTDTIDLELDSTVASGDALGTLTYTDSDSEDEIKSGNTGNTIALDGDSVTVSNNVGTAPVLQNVTIDDAGVNNNYGNNGEMLLAFDQAVTEASDDTSGLTFDSGLEGVSVSTVDIKNPENSPDNVIVVTYTSDSGSASSNIQADDDLSGATLTVDNAANVGITGDDPDNNQITENTVSEVSNEIAGDLATVESTEINAELIGTEVDTKFDEAEEDLTVTVTGLRDSAGNRVIDDTVQVNISGATTDGLKVTPNRFSDTATTSETPEDISKGDVDIGSEATVDVDGADVTNADTVTYVHEAFTASEGYQFESQPMPGEFVATENISDITYYDADASGDEDVFATYGSESEVQDVHNALFVNAESDGAEYGFAYDEDRSGAQTNVGDISMGEGWHIVGSNYDISSSSIELQDDLATENLPSSSAIDVQLKSLPGTTLSDTATVDDHAVYYVYVYQEDNRAIVLPAYSSTADTGSSVSEA